jgi:ATP-dependent DNA helicase RecG
VIVGAMVDLVSSVQYVKGVGPHRAEALAGCGIETVEDLLFHLPLRYEDRTSFAPISALRPGMKVSVRGTVLAAGIRRARRMTLFEVLVGDAGGRLKALWFNQPYLKDALGKGKTVVLFGSVEKDAYGGRHLLMSSPQYEVMEAEPGPGIHTGRVVPIYERLGPLSGKVLRRILTSLAEKVEDDLPDPLPAEVRERLGLVPRGEALRRVHIPSPADEIGALNAFRSPSHVRLILEELFLFQVGLALKRRSVRRERKSSAFAITDTTREVVKKILPFHLTFAQKRVLKEIADDMRSPHPLNRLVQGDVGSGKTVVALLSMVVAVENGYQAAFMAPTEILAEQHHLTFKRLLARCPYETLLLTSETKGRQEALQAIASGKAQIVVGTHALIQEGVRFKRLGLAVVDEQHRFGVLQREDLMKKGYDSDVLVMTATPIPRTLALTAYGDLDTSVIDERPPGRTPIRTLHLPSSARREVVDLVRAEVLRGGQAYVVYPLVEESEKLEDVKAATAMAASWGEALPGLRVALLHGRMKGAEKEAVMAAFLRGDVRVLVATTVVEVGVDVENATIMVIEHAERFGLAQLHQLRGRVGRGRAASTCVLMSHGRVSPVARSRLEALLGTEDGFVIAEKDLEIRGPGDFFGTRQSGMPSFRVSHLLRDRDLLEAARKEALLFVEARGEAMGSLGTFFKDGEWERRFRLARVG